ncbi:hypothetical protein KY290_024790 [Solanum tuberosum]|uniref:Aminotransferase-like plant mobile domain-containing protein n=1 Tax=Solanum tuberosum TaxID=4113 RepID=A0ABQ7URQ0_SOLTU|nr:hypothetical protein KY284_023649 [Solanum tuberosum]KAH0754520.1 hypothetical protein KY290_024790 [Solanum tuberosum]
MEKIIKEFDIDILVPEVFVPYSKSSLEFMLGSCFKDGFPLELEPFYPLAEGEKLLLHTLQPRWHKKQHVQVMANCNGRLDRLGNSFHFHFGMMSPTVFDISALTGIRPHGEAISSVLDIQNSTFSMPKSEKNKKIYYEEFIKVNMQREDKTEEEQFAFLNMLLCKFVFCNGSSRVTMEYNKLAIVLASGKKVALAPFILSHIYRGCRSLVTQGFGTTGGPFWQWRSHMVNEVVLALRFTQLYDFWDFPGSSQFTLYSPGWLRLAVHIPSIRLPPHQSVNASPLERIVFDSESGIREVDSRFDQLKRNFSVVEFHPKPKCTPSFESWWSTYISKTRTESSEEILDTIIAGEAIKKRRNKDSISQQEKDRPTKSAKRELVLPDIEHSPDVLCSSHSSVNRHDKSVAYENVAPLSSDVKSPTAQYSTEVLDKDKAEVQKLLMMPFQQVLLPENYSSLEAALPIYAESTDISVEISHDLEELRRNLPSLLANFQELKKQKDEYYKDTAKKVMLVNNLIKKQELHHELKDLLVGIDASISNLKEIEAQEMNLTTEISHLEATLEELMRDEFPASKKDAADSLATQAELS